MKKFAVLLFFALLSGGLSRANDIYLSQSGAGAGDASSCGNAKPVSFFNSSANWGTGTSQIGPGDTVHLCGAITGSAGSTALTFQGSGTSTSPISLLFESGAGLTAPYWSTNGAIVVNARNYITIDGGSNGYVMASGNGTNLGNRQDTVGIAVNLCTGCTVKNLNIPNLYVHSGLGSDGGNTYGIKFYGGSNNTISGNTVHDVRWAIFYACPGSATTSNIAITNNTIYNIDHGVSIGDGNSGAVLSAAVIAGNTFHDMVNWDNTANVFHHDYIHIFESNGGSNYSGVQVYNNYFYGDPGANVNSLLFMEVDSGNTNTAWKVFNNIFTNSSAQHTAPYGNINGSGGTNPTIANNTVIGSTTSQGNANSCIFVQGTGFTINNNICTNLAIGINRDPNATIAKSDYNSFYNLGSTAAISNGSAFYSFSSWKSACACDSHSINTAPNIQTASPFRPNSGSPLISTGINLTILGLTTLNKDFVGQLRPTALGWDIGATQYGSSSSATAPNAPTGLSASVQ